MNIRKDDTVTIIAGKDKGTKGKVRRVFPRQNRVVVEGLNMTKRHSKTQGKAQQAGIIELEAPLSLSNVMLVCNKCGKATRVTMRILGDGSRVRICRSCGEAID